MPISRADISLSGYLNAVSSQVCTALACPFDSSSRPRFAELCTYRGYQPVRLFHCSIVAEVMSHSTTLISIGLSE